MDFYAAVKQRRSIRGYLPKAIEVDKLERVMEAVRLAPSACNRQPFRFLLISNQETKNLVAETYDKDWLRAAPIVVVALGDRDEAWKRLNGTSAHVIDTAIAMEHLVLAAAAEGLGTCWICAFDQQELHRRLALEADWDVVAITPLGYPDAEPRTVGRKRVADLFEQIK